MKLNLKNLAEQLNQSLAPVYFISGDELLLIEETLSLICSVAEKAGFSEYIRIPVEPNANWGEIVYSTTHSLSLFAEKRILEIDLRNQKLHQAHTDILKHYAENPLHHTILLLYTHKLDSKITQSRWYQSIEKNGATLILWPISKEQLPQWILQRAKHKNLSLSLSGAQWIAEQTEGNLFAASQEIEKLQLLFPNGIVDEDQLMEIVGNHAHFDIFNLVDSMLMGNSKRSLQILSALFSEDTEPALIVWAIARELRTLADMLEKIKQGISLSTLFNQFRIWEKRQACVRAFLTRSNIQKCWEALKEGAKIDRIIKGNDSGNVKDELEKWILSII